MAVLLLLRDEVPLVRFPLGEVATLGRASECEVQLVDTELSRRHAQVRRTASGWELEDLGSRNGTRVDGVRVQGTVALAPGAVIALGVHTLVFDPPVDVVGDADGDHRLLLLRDEAAARGARALPASAALPPAELTRMHALGLSLVATADRGGLRELLARLAAELGAERACLVAATRAATVAPRPFRPICVHGATTVTTSTTLVARVLAEGTALAVDDAQGHVSFAGAESVLTHDLRAVLVAPLVYEGAALGVVQLDHRRRGAFDDGALARVAALAPAIALSVARAMRPPVTPAPPPPATIIGGDARLRAALDAVSRAAASGTQVLVLGESGTGKELVARAYHASSPRSSGPWVAVNCAAFTETLLDSELFGHEQGAFTGATRRRRGCFEQADGGTLFLDEVGELGAATQAKLLRVLADRRFYRLGGEQPIDVDVRVIAATHRDLRARVAAGAFRDDLYWRIAVIPIDVPPLRERGEDRAALTAHFFERLAVELGRRPPTLSPEAQALWDRHPWPGNVRELKNAVERLLVLHDGGVVDVDDLPPELRAHAGRPAPGSLGDAVAALERDRIASAMAVSGGNKAAAARALGISRPTLDKKLRELLPDGVFT
ncbi:MAG TPA: sigma 54-interacting transcriptional regulator [Kofleriaceae bacterium]|nr:sigma 54-interacting transcriptional regulator [Kofleriaceae bacterium]